MSGSGVFDSVFRMFDSLRRFLGVKAKRISGEVTSLKIDADLLCCPVCFEIFVDPPLVLECGHTLCKGCLSRLTGRFSGRDDTFQCPLCRKQIAKRQQFPKNYTVESILGSLDDWVSTELSREHSEQNNERIAMKRLKKKVDELSSENSQLKRELQQTAKRQNVRILLSSILAALVAYITHRFII